MRRVFILLVLIVLLAVTFYLNRLTSNWHYVLPAEPGQVTYLATFDGFKDDWQQYQGTLAAQILENGMLRIEAAASNSGPFSVAKQHFSDFDLHVQATPVDGPEDNGYGVIFRLQDNGNTDFSDDSYYWFLISSDGYYQVMRVLNGQSKRLSDWIPSPLIQTGMNVTNVIRVTASSDQFRFYINGSPVQLCMPDNPNGESTYQEFGDGCVQGRMVDTLTDNTIPTGKLGVIAHSFELPEGETRVVIDFDNVVVFGPEET